MTITLSDLPDHIGKELGVSDWILVDQARIDAFADCTGDHQWVHVDIEKAKTGPFGTTVAHGYLTLSLVAGASFDVIGPLALKGAFNYGIDKLRFIAPVKSGARVRNRMKLLALEEKPGGRHLMTIENTMEIEGEDKPALIAATLVMIQG
jgi:acyl dehydratase